MSEAAEQLAAEAPSPVEGATALDKPIEAKPISKEYQILVNREKALQRAREEIKAEKALVESEKLRVKEIEAKYGTKPKNPREALERYGWKYDDATQYELNDGNPTPEIMAKTALERLEEFKKAQEDDKKLQAEAQLKAEEERQAEVIVNFKQEISSYVETKTEDCELIKIFGAENLIFDTIEEYFNTHKKVLSITEGAQLVERYCEDIAKKYLASKKYQKSNVPVVGPAQPAALKKQEPRTLSNSLTPSTTPSLVSPKLESDRIRRALAALG